MDDHTAKSRNSAKQENVNWLGVEEGGGGAAKNRQIPISRAPFLSRSDRPTLDNPHSKIEEVNDRRKYKLAQGGGGGGIPISLYRSILVKETPFLQEAYSTKRQPVCLCNNWNFSMQ